MDYRGRFAPSPTGRLHAGSLVAALAGWLATRKAGGTWLVRVEDIDPPREVEGSAQAILDTLQRLGLGPDAPPLFQSTRVEAYAAALEILRASGDAFPCWCSRADLARHGGIHRDGRCVSDPDRSRPPAWRLRVPDTVIAFDDLMRGPQRANVREQAGDFVLKRSDGYWAYQLACVVDDGFQRISDVVRGADLLDSTPRQILLQQMLDLPPPRYMHLPLVRDARGRKLSKSDADAPLDVRPPVDVLREALLFLGLPARADTPEELLHDALAAFDAEAWRRMVGTDSAAAAAGPT